MSYLLRYKIEQNCPRVAACPPVFRFGGRRDLYCARETLTQSATEASPYKSSAGLADQTMLMHCLLLHNRILASGLEILWLSYVAQRQHSETRA